MSGCVILTGMPGAGKTTVSKLVAGLLPRAAVVAGDAVNAMIHSGYVWFLGSPRGEALRQDELCNRNMCALANNFIDFGFTVLLDTVVSDRDELDFFLALMSPRPVRLVVLAPGVEVCKDRNANREPSEQFQFDDYERLEADMLREFSELGWWLDTSDMTSQQAAEQVAANIIGGSTVVEPKWNAWLRRLHSR
jgi:predicted kinase